MTNHNFVVAYELTEGEVDCAARLDDTNKEGILYVDCIYDGRLDHDDRQFLYHLDIEDYEAIVALYPEEYLPTLSYFNVSGDDVGAAWFVKEARQLCDIDDRALKFIGQIADRVAADMVAIIRIAAFDMIGLTKVAASDMLALIKIVAAGMVDPNIPQQLVEDVLAAVEAEAALGLETDG